MVIKSLSDKRFLALLLEGEDKGEGGRLGFALTLPSPARGRGKIMCEREFFLD